ncbi:hypothetical protein L1987_09167 [Smallanthus sonchifolius]|uniref:Uncharacterized protein n=1 Tax=Smallanthus sonchifolius TaxID=185202 RepID=A0ACB9JPA5_9ASTR|nr:hypothetical protein L1987_09167 [Smallanthus sonchifolius]
MDKDSRFFSMERQTYFLGMKKLLHRPHNLNLLVTLLEYPIRNGKALCFINGSKQFKTKGGLLAGTATSNVYRSEQFKKTMKEIQTPCCSPDEVIFGPDFHQSLYCHILCGLIFHDEIQVISSTFAHSIVHPC